MRLQFRSCCVVKKICWVCNSRLLNLVFKNPCVVKARSLSPAHFLRCWQGLVEQSKASLVGNHFLYSQEIRCASLLWVKRLNCVQWGFSHSWLVFFFKAHEQSWSILGIHNLLNFLVVRKHTYPVWHRACLNSHSEDTNHPEKQYTLSLSSQFP